MNEVVTRGFAAIVGLIGIFCGWPAMAGSDVANGKKVFRKCGACHTNALDIHGLGPSLVGVVGNRPGQVSGYRYSKSMKAFAEAGAVWDEATLDAFLAKPQRLVKGTRMVFPGIKKDKDRADIIAYLEQLQAN